MIVERPKRDITTKHAQWNIRKPPDRNKSSPHFISLGDVVAQTCDREYTSRITSLIISGSFSRLLRAWLLCGFFQPLSILDNLYITLHDHQNFPIETSIISCFPYCPAYRCPTAGHKFALWHTKKINLAVYESWELSGGLTGPKAHIKTCQTILAKEH